MPFPNQNNWNHLTLTPFRQDKRQIKIEYKTGLDYLVDSFPHLYFSPIISALPEKFQNFFVTGGASAAPHFRSPLAVRLWRRAFVDTLKKEGRVIRNLEKYIPILFNQPCFRLLFNQLIAD